MTSVFEGPKTRPFSWKGSRYMTDNWLAEFKNLWRWSCTSAGNYGDLLAASNWEQKMEPNGNRNKKTCSFITESIEITLLNHVGMGKVKVFIYMVNTSRIVESCRSWCDTISKKTSSSQFERISQATNLSKHPNLSWSDCHPPDGFYTRFEGAQIPRLQGYHHLGGYPFVKFRGGLTNHCKGNSTI